MQRNWRHLDPSRLIDAERSLMTFTRRHDRVIATALGFLEPAIPRMSDVGLHRCPPGPLPEALRFNLRPAEQGPA